MEVKIIIEDAGRLKVVVAEDMSIENLMLAKSRLMDLQVAYDSYEYPVPEWIDEKYNEISAELEAKMAARLVFEIKREKALQENWKPKAEKRKDSEVRVKNMTKTLERLQGKA